MTKHIFQGLGPDRWHRGAVANAERVPPNGGGNPKRGPRRCKYEPSPAERCSYDGTRNDTRRLATSDDVNVLWRWQRHRHASSDPARLPAFVPPLDVSRAPSAPARRREWRAGRAPPLRPHSATAPDRRGPKRRSPVTSPPCARGVLCIASRPRSRSRASAWAVRPRGAAAGGRPRWTYARWQRASRRRAGCGKSGRTRTASSRAPRFPSWACAASRRWRRSPTPYRIRPPGSAASSRGRTRRGRTARRPWRHRHRGTPPYYR